MKPTEKVQLLNNWVVYRASSQLANDTTRGGAINREAAEEKQLWFFKSGFSKLLKVEVFV